MEGRKGKNSFYTANVDPQMVRFAHSKIKPVFSCGRTIEDTLTQILSGTLKICDIPQITLIEGPLDKKTNQQWFFSLNNRRLYLFKRLRELGHLPDNVVAVRVRAAQTHEKERYTLQKCALEARLMGTVQAAKGDTDSDEAQDQNLVNQKTEKNHSDTDDTKKNTSQAQEQESDTSCVEQQTHQLQKLDGSDTVQQQQEIPKKSQNSNNKTQNQPQTTKPKSKGKSKKKRELEEDAQWEAIKSSNKTATSSQKNQEKDKIDIQKLKQSDDDDDDDGGEY